MGLPADQFLFPISRGDAVEVRMERFSGVADGEPHIAAFWRPATVVTVRPDGVMGVVFANHQRMMVRPEQWRRAAEGGGRT